MYILVQIRKIINMNFMSHIKVKKTIQVISDDGEILNLESLLILIEKNKKLLNQIGIKKNDVVAIVLDNGIKFISSFFSVINSCISAPLNPNYSEREFNFYYSDLKPKVLVTDMKDDHASVKVAKKRKIKILNLKKNLFENTKKSLVEYVKTNNTPLLKDTALILHTSGTTSKPKMVALSHENLLSSCKNITKALELKSKDKNMILMPSFHIHGIVASILAPLYVGGKVVALPKFNALSFFNSLDFHKPTWFTAVPTMLQSLLDREKSNKKIVKNNRLKFIRSSSASLPNHVLEKLEKTFKVPVIESYGMTEASHQMTTNLLIPLGRKVGSVGVPVGLKVKIVDHNFKNLNKNEIGEVVIKGRNVLKSYLAEKKINDAAFFKGWFKTGDLGYFDKDGFLYITGRIKEIINRGGEKISPKEIDDVFTSYSKVDKAIAFSIQHEKLGEDVCVAIVLKINLNCTSSELKEYAKNKLAPFKIPKKIVFVKSIPIGATGKIQRIGLAKKLGIEK